MNKRERELLDKQLWGVSRIPPRRHGAIIALTAVAGILTGMAIGDGVVANQNKPTLIKSHDAMAVLLSEQPISQFVPVITR
jgi:hypothetical protein